MTIASARRYSAALFLGCLLGCAYTLAGSERADDIQGEPAIGPTTTARWIAPLAVPPRANYGAPYVESRVHPVAVAAGITAASFLGLMAFSPTPPKTPNRMRGRWRRSRSA